jgi:predicted CoA-binding protein
MKNLQVKVDDFLAQKSIAVAGVSRNTKSEAANAIYKKLRDSEYTVYPINPSAETVEGDICYSNLRSVPNKVESVVICTRPEVALEIVKECIELDIKHVWMHRSFGPGSVSEEAAELCKKNDITVIAGACPMMYCQPVDFGHKCMHWILKVLGKLPE